MKHPRERLADAELESPLATKKDPDELVVLDDEQLTRLDEYGSCLAWLVVDGEKRLISVRCG